MGTSKLILLRHGESLYNKENIFTGWTDVDLSEKGRKEAKEAGEILLKHALYPDSCFTSWLKRSIHTAQIVLVHMGWEQIDQLRSWKLNERHYGAWQERNKKEVEEEVGHARFIAVRRGYDTPPPALPDNDPRLPQNELKYSRIDPLILPRSESLKDTRQRTLLYYSEKILPALERGDTVLVSAHGNSLRALIMEIEQLNAEEIVKVEIPTGRPILFTFKEMQLVKKEYLKG